MGMFDSVYAPCPKCGKKHEVQSKAGDCILGEFTLDNAPPSILDDIAGERICCIACGVVFVIKVKIVTEAKTVVASDDDEGATEND